MFTSPIRARTCTGLRSPSVRSLTALLSRRPQAPSLALPVATQLPLPNTSTVKPYKRFTMFSTRNLVTISSSLVEGLKKHLIFPDVLDEFLPQGLLTINYGDNIDVVLGNTLKVKDTQSLPRVQFTLNVESPKDPDTNQVSSFSANDYFTLVLTDPDAPSRTDKKWSEYAHYIKTNIKLIDKDNSKNDDFLSAALDLSGSSATYLDYQGPAPPPKTGKHRYVFLLFRQKSEINPSPLPDRPNWGYGKPATGVKKWASENNLEPVAANFFYAQNETQ